jgi:hypothetical protein
MTIRYSLATLAITASTLLLARRIIVALSGKMMKNLDYYEVRHLYNYRTCYLHFDLFATVLVFGLLILEYNLKLRNESIYHLRIVS